MPIRKTKPTSPGSALRDLPAARGADQRTAPQAADQGQVARAAGATPTAGSRRATAAAAPSAATAQIDFKRRKDGVPARVATIEYDPNRTCYIALLHYADGAEELHPRAAGRCSPAIAVESGERADIRPGNALPLRSIPTGHHRPQRRAGSRPGRPPRPRRPASAIQVVGEGGRDGHAAPALVGDADGPRRLPRHRGRALERRAPERQDRQGGPQPPQGPAPADPRRGDEPGRPPARRRRGAPHARRPSR